MRPVGPRSEFTLRVLLAAEVEKNSKLIKAAKDSDIQVVDIGFVEAVKKGGAALLIKQHSICSWGSEVHFVCHLTCLKFCWTILTI